LLDGFDGIMSRYAHSWTPAYPAGPMVHMPMGMGQIPYYLPSHHKNFADADYED
jgi:hypothetical protein